MPYAELRAGDIGGYLEIKFTYAVWVFNDCDRETKFKFFHADNKIFTFQNVLVLSTELVKDKFYVI